MKERERPESEEGEKRRDLFYLSEEKEESSTSSSFL